MDRQHHQPQQQAGGLLFSPVQQRQPHLVQRGYGQLHEAEGGTGTLAAAMMGGPLTGGSHVHTEHHQQQPQHVTSAAMPSLLFSPPTAGAAHTLSNSASGFRARRTASGSTAITSGRKARTKTKLFSSFMDFPERDDAQRSAGDEDASARKDVGFGFANAGSDAACDKEGVTHNGSEAQATLFGSHDHAAKVPGGGGSVGDFSSPTMAGTFDGHMKSPSPSPSPEPRYESESVRTMRGDQRLVHEANAGDCAGEWNPPMAMWHDENIDGIPDGDLPDNGDKENDSFGAHGNPRAGVGGDDASSMRSDLCGDSVAVNRRKLARTRSSHNMYTPQPDAGILSRIAQLVFGT